MIDPKPGDLITLKVLEITNGLVTFEVVGGDGQELHMILPPKPLGPYPIDEWRKNDLAYQRERRKDYVSRQVQQDPKDLEIRKPE